MNRRRLRHLTLACVVAVGAVLALTATPGLQQTQAAWTDPEHATSGTGPTALRLVPDQITGGTCSRPNALAPGSTAITATWRWPATAPYTGFAASNSVWGGANGTAFSPQPATSGPVSEIFTTTVTNRVLAQRYDLTAISLTGGTIVVSASTRWTTAGGVVWSSPTRSTITMTVPAVTGAPTCSFSNGS